MPTINLIYCWLLEQFKATAYNDTTAIDQLKDRLIDLNQAAIDIQNKADAEERALSDDENENIDNILQEFKNTERDIERRERVIANAQQLAEPSGRQSTPGDQIKNKSEFRQYREPIDPKARGKHGFNHMGEFAKAVRIAAQQNGHVDPRLIQNAPTTVSTEGTGADGGFAVPPEFRNDIQRLVMGEDSLIGMTDQLTSSSNTMTFPKDETTPWQTTGGIQSYWEGEGNQLTQSKINLDSNSVRLNKLTTLVPVTEELLDDASGLDSYLRAKVPEKMDFKITDAIVNGDGAGKPQGFMNSGALVTVAKESGQAADTVVAANINNMWSRCYGPARRSAVWLINQDIEPQLEALTLEGTSSSIPLFVPPGGLSETPYGRLKGRPVITTQSAQTLGDLGDIALVDLSKYMTIRKTEGVRSDVSMHLYFDYDTVAYRFILRIAGQSWYSNAITPKNSANTLSPFVTLAARA